MVDIECNVKRWRAFAGEKLLKWEGKFGIENAIGKASLEAKIDEHFNFNYTDSKLSIIN